MASTEEIEQYLNDRMEVLRAERMAMREAFNALDGKITAARKAQGPPPKDSVDSVNKEITAYEKAYGRNSHSNSEDRAFMWELNKLKEKKKHLATFSRSSQEIEKMINTQNELRNLMLEKETAIDEIQAALQKVAIAKKAHTSTAEVVSSRYRVSDLIAAMGRDLEVEDVVGRVMGKGGTSLRMVEEAHNVAVTFHPDGSFSLLGTTSSILSAYTAIYLMADTNTTEVALTDAAGAYLVSSQFNLVKELSAKHDVTMDVSVAKGCVKITGQAALVSAAVADIKIINSAISTSSLLLEPGWAVFIIGAKGATIRHLESSHSVLCNVTANGSQLTVIGVKENVLKALENVKELIGEQKEITVSIPVEKHVYMGGVMPAMRGMGKEHGVRIDVDHPVPPAPAAVPDKPVPAPAAAPAVAVGDKDKGKGKKAKVAAPAAPAAASAPAPVAAPVVHKMDTIHTVHVKGPNHKVLAAKEALQRVIKAYMDNTVILAIPSAILPLILGKGGEAIKALRAAHPAANIDIYNDTVFIHAETIEREGIAKHIRETIASNHTGLISLSEVNLAALLKSRWFNGTLKPAMEAAGLTVMILRKESCIRLRGDQQAVGAYSATISAHVDQLTTEAVEVARDDYNIFVKPLTGGGTLLQTLEELYDTDIAVDKGTTNGAAAVTKMSVRGLPAAIAATVAHITGILSGQLAYFSLVMAVDRLLAPALIGKQGSNIKRLEQVHSAIIDYNRSAQLLRIVCVAKELADRTNAVKAAQVEISRAIATTKVSDAVLITDRLVWESEDKEAKESKDKEPKDKEAKDGKDKDSKEQNTIQAPPLVDALVRKLMDIFTVDIDRLSAPSGAARIAIRGTIAQLADVRSFLSYFYPSQETAVFRLPLKPEMLAKLRGLGKLPKNLEIFSSKYHAQVCMEEGHVAYRLLQPALPAPTTTAACEELVTTVLTKQTVIRQAFIKHIHSLFPAQTAFLEVPRAFLWQHQQAIRYELSALGVLCAMDLLFGILFIAGDVLDQGMEHIDTILTAWTASHAMVSVRGQINSKTLLSKLRGELAERVQLTSDRYAGMVCVHLLDKKEQKAAAVKDEQKQEQETKQEEQKELTLADAVEAVQEAVRSIEKEHRVLPIDSSLLPVFIGKAGANINALRTEYGVTIDIDQRGLLIKLNGPEDKVSAAAAHIESFLEKEAVNLPISRSVYLTSGAVISALIGPKGANIRSLETLCEVKMDIDKVFKKVTVRGRATACEKALTEINSVLTAEGHPVVTFQTAPPLAPVAAPQEPEEEKPAANTSKPIPGAGVSYAAAMVAQAATKQLSKSAQRRLRRKLSANQEGEDEEEEEEVEAAPTPEPEPVAVAPVPAPAPIQMPAASPVPALTPATPVLASLLKIAPTMPLAPVLPLAPTLPEPLVFKPAVPVPAAPAPAPVRAPLSLAPVIISPALVQPAPAAALAAVTPKASAAPVAPAPIVFAVPPVIPVVPVTPRNTLSIAPAPSTPTAYKQSDLLALLLGSPTPASVPLSAPPAISVPAPAAAAAYSQFGAKSLPEPLPATVAPPAVAAVPAPAKAAKVSAPPGFSPTHAAAGGDVKGNYYKSKSGLTVRL